MHHIHTVKQLTTDLFVLPHLVKSVHIMVLIQSFVIVPIHKLYQMYQIYQMMISQPGWISSSFGGIDKSFR
jgi:hypothetical protein